MDWEVDGVDENSHLREDEGIKFWLPCKMVCGFEVCLDVFLDVCLAWMYTAFCFLLSAVCFLLKFYPLYFLRTELHTLLLYRGESYDSNNFDYSLSQYDYRP